MTTQQIENPPAFPNAVYTDLGGNPVHPASLHDSFGGMTLRDYFAAKAMQGLLASGRCVDDELIRESICAANLMLAARTKGPQ